jgi:hypothetical protein
MTNHLSAVYCATERGQKSRGKPYLEGLFKTVEKNLENYKKAEGKLKTVSKCFIR